MIDPLGDKGKGESDFENDQFKFGTSINQF